MEGWEIGLLAITGYVAVMALARLMIDRRNRLLVQLREEVEQERRRRKDAEKKKKEQEAWNDDAAEQDRQAA